MLASFDAGGYTTWKGIVIEGLCCSAAACGGDVDIVGLRVSVWWEGKGGEGGYEEAMSIDFST